MIKIGPRFISLATVQNVAYLHGLVKNYDLHKTAPFNMRLSFEFLVLQGLIRA